MPLYHSISYHTILYCIILYYAMLYYTALYYTKPSPLLYHYLHNSQSYKTQTSESIVIEAPSGLRKGRGRERGRMRAKGGDTDRQRHRQTDRQKKNSHL